MRVSLLLCLAACHADSAPAAAPAPREKPAETLAELVGHPAPPFSLPSVSGDAKVTVPSADVTVVTFFGTWSMGWQVALPTLNALAKKHPGLRVLAVSMDDESPREVAAKYAPLTIAWSGGIASETNQRWLSRPYGGENKVFVLDRKGVIRFAHGGGKESSVFLREEGRATVESEIATVMGER